MQKLGDVLKQSAPFLELSSDYVSNLDYARNMAEECLPAVSVPLRFEALQICFLLDCTKCTMLCN